MKVSRNGSMNKLIIYKYPIFERIFVMGGSILISFLPLIYLLAGLFNDDIELLGGIFFQIITIFLIFVMYFHEFKTYISFDLYNNKITIKNGLKKEVLSLDGLIRITVETSDKYPDLFYIYYNYKYIGYSKKDFSWSGGGPSSRVVFGTLHTQRRRLEKFCAECNSLLDAKKENI